MQCLQTYHCRWLHVGKKWILKRPTAKWMNEWCSGTNGRTDGPGAVFQLWQIRNWCQFKTSARYLSLLPLEVHCLRMVIPLNSELPQYEIMLGKCTIFVLNALHTQGSPTSVKCFHFAWLGLFSAAFQVCRATHKFDSSYLALFGQVFDKLKLSPHDGARWKVRVSPKLLQFIMRWTWKFVPHFTTIHPVVVEIFH